MVQNLKANLHSRVCFSNPPVDEVPEIGRPRISETAAVACNSLLVGDITLAEEVFVGFYSLIRADSASPFFIGPRTNIQDLVVLHSHPGLHIMVEGRKMGIHIANDVSILHHAVPHGPLYVGSNTYIGHHVSIYGGHIGANCVIMHHASISNEVRIGDNRYVAPGQVIENQEQADALPQVPSRYRELNAQIVEHYLRLGRAYKQQGELFL